MIHLLHLCSIRLQCYDIWHSMHITDNHFLYRPGFRMAQGVECGGEFQGGLVAPRCSKMQPWSINHGKPLPLPLSPSWYHIQAHIPPSPDAIYGPIQSRGCVTKQTNRCPSHSRGFLNCLCYTYATHRGQMLTSIQSKTSYGTMQRRFEGY